MKHKVEFDVASKNKFERLLKVKQQFIQEKEGIGVLEQQYSKAISMLILQEYYKLDDNTAYDYITDGSNDKDIDGFYYDQSGDITTLVLIQSKYKKESGSTGTFEEKEIVALINTAKKIILGEEIDNINEEIKKMLQDYKKLLKEIGNPPVNIVLFYATNGIIHEGHKKIKEVIDSNRYSISCNFIDVNHFITNQKPFKSTLFINKKVINSDEDLTDNIFISKGFLCSTSLENFMKFYSESGEKLLLNENVRFLIAKSQINEEILKSFIYAPEKFCFLNNGIYIVCENVIPGLTTEKNISNLTFHNPSIINGGQTTAILYSLYGKDEYIENFRKANVFIRIYKIDPSFLNNYEITKATNSQNKIDIVDLEANNIFQIKVKEFFSKRGIGLLVKEGEETVDYIDTISNEALLQSYVAIYLGIPDLAKRSKKTVFKQNINSVFNEEMLEKNNISEKLYRCYEIHKLLQERKPTKKENPRLKSFIENAWYSLMYTIVNIDNKILDLKIDYGNLENIFNHVYNQSEMIIQEIVDKRSEELKERFSMNNLFKSTDIKDLIDLKLQPILVSKIKNILNRYIEKRRK